jgi:predicted membrane GTPase involved in stress response
VVTEKLSARKGQMRNMINHGSGRVRIEFALPARGLIGYRDEFLTDTRGTGLLNTYFAGYDTFRGEIPSRFTGSIVSDRQGVAVAYALFNLEPRGRLFVRPGEPVYEGMIFGEHNRATDLNANPCKEKKLTNMRASGHDESVILSPIRPMTLEWALHFIREDEMVEVTPVPSACARACCRPSSGTGSARTRWADTTQAGESVRLFLEDDYTAPLSNFDYNVTPFPVRHASNEKSASANADSGLLRPGVGVRRRWR